MSRALQRTLDLAEESRRQRAALGRSLGVWRDGARRIDDSVRRVHDHRAALGLLAGFGAGILVALRPSLLVASARAAVTILPLLRILRR